MILLLKKACYSCLHGIFLFILTLFALNTDYTFQFEERVINWTSAVWRIFHTLPDQSTPFVFIDVSGNPRLLDREDGTGANLITDRGKLALFFEQLAKLGGQRQPLVICDLLFKDKSPEDARMQRALDGLQRIIIAIGRDEKGLIKPVFSNVPTGYAGYYMSSGFNASSKLVKFNLCPDPGGNSVPLQWAATARNVTPEKHLGLLFWNDGVYFNNLIPYMRIPTSRIFDKNGGMRILSLNEITGMLSGPDPASFDGLIQGKTVVVGDFQNDQHFYYGGKMPGAVLFTNIFLGLQAGDNRISFGWLILMVFLFSLLSWFFLYPPKWHIKWIDWIRAHILGYFVFEMLTFGFVLCALCFLSYQLFNKYTDVVYIDIYLSAVATVRHCLNLNKKNNYDTQIAGRLHHDPPYLSASLLCIPCQWQDHPLSWRETTDNRGADHG